MPATPNLKLVETPEIREDMAPKAKKPRTPKKPKTPKLKAAHVLLWLQAHPTFFADNAEHLGTMVVPKKGGNILSLHAMKAARVETSAARLAARHKQFLQLAKENAATIGLLQNLTLHAMGLKTLASFRTWVQTGLKQALGLHAAKLLFVAEKTTATTITAEELETRAPAGQTVHLRNLYTVEETALYGPRGKLLKAECLLRIENANGHAFALLALASEDPTRFHEGQGTETTTFFAKALGSILTRYA